MSRPVNANTTIDDIVNALVAAARIKEARLLLRLERIEARLGTPYQQPTDEDEARKIAHRLVSLACAIAADRKPSQPAALK